MSNFPQGSKPDEGGEFVASCAAGGRLLTLHPRAQPEPQQPPIKPRECSGPYISLQFALRDIHIYASMGTTSIHRKGRFLTCNTNAGPFSIGWSLRGCPLVATRPGLLSQN
jgi:hypothetical protein